MPTPSKDLLNLLKKIPTISRDQAERGVWAILSFTSPSKNVRKDASEIIDKIVGNETIMHYLFEGLVRMGSMGFFAKVLEPLTDMWSGKWKLPPDKYKQLPKLIATGIQPYVEKWNPSSRDYTIALSLAAHVHTIVEKLKEQTIDDDKGIDDALVTSMKLVRSLQFLKTQHIK